MLYLLLGEEGKNVDKAREKDTSACLLCAVSCDVRVKTPCFFSLRVVCVATVCCLPPSYECVFCFRCVSVFGRGASHVVTLSRLITVTIRLIRNCSKETWLIYVGELIWLVADYRSVWNSVFNTYSDSDWEKLVFLKLWSSEKRLEFLQLLQGIAASGSVILR